MDWMAPEILEFILDCAVNKNLHETIQSNVFSAGCVFFYFLSHGRHPFGDRLIAPGNILNFNPVELIRRQKRGNYFICMNTLWYTSDARILIADLHDALLYNLIEKMLKGKEERIALPNVIKQLKEKLTASRKSNFSLLIEIIDLFILKTQDNSREKNSQSSKSV
jgi:serine/threonine protein kinase